MPTPIPTDVRHGAITQVLLPDLIREALLENGKLAAIAIAKDGNTQDHVPVVKLFAPDGGATWLLTELDPEDNDTAFGLCDLGMGSPELGYVSLAEITNVRGFMDMKIERDEWFDPQAKTLTQYAEEARQHGGIRA